MTKRLERTPEAKVVAGVLAGLADYFDQDPRLFRILAIALLIFTGIFPGLLLYIVAWVIMPLRRITHVDYEA
jgi:phage shock protein C